MAGNSGEDALRINIGNIMEIQVAGNQCRLPVKDPLIQADEKLRRDEGVRHLRAQIIDDQQIAVKNIPIIFGGRSIPLEGVSGQQIKKPVSAEVDDGMTGIQQFLCYTVGQKGFADTGVSEEQDIFKFLIELLRERTTFGIGVLCGCVGRNI